VPCRSFWQLRSAVAIGLLAGYAGGFSSTRFLWRIADIQLSFPAILIALTIDGLARAFLSARRHEEAAIMVLVLAIGLSKWAMFAPYGSRLDAGRTEQRTM